MPNPIAKYPHIYKKGKILNLKPLQEDINIPRNYVFSSSNPTLKNIIEHCNNLNQIVARIFLGLAKLNSYFGLSKDPSEKLSKDPSIFNLFNQTSFFRGGELGKEIDNLKTLLKFQTQKIEVLEKKIDDLKKLDDHQPIDRNEVLDFTNRLKEIQEKLTQVIG